jgi:hypothetical protein
MATRRKRKNDSWFSFLDAYRLKATLASIAATIGLLVSMGVVDVGKLPPLLQAVGVLELEIGRRGEVVALRWTRPPRQVPKVMAEIESMVHAAAPFPAPVRMGKISYTEVWLWHKSGRFQLDSLTEGQK